MKTYKEFIEYCLKNDLMEGICSLEEYNKMGKQLKEDGFVIKKW